jgi:DNA-binding CsgD family transcriptional regulator
MFEDRNPATGSGLATVDRAGSTGHAVRLGVERRQRPDSRREGASDWRFELLNELDYGIVVLDWDGRLLYVNQAARSRLLGTQALRLERGELVATQPRDASLLASAVRAAAVQGLRRMVRVGAPSQQLALAVVPGPHCPGPNRHRVLVMLPRGQLCEPLSAYGFARDHGLSAAETQVLQLLCDGHQPIAIASVQSVAIATVRTQIASIRIKTDTATVVELLQRVARLPPIRSALSARAADPSAAGRFARLS